ncbi:hypothetical protein BH23CHL5_BH23CHL5_24840 [soil metagenome]
MMVTRRTFLGGTAAAAVTAVHTPLAYAQGDGTQGPDVRELLLPNYRILSYYGFPGNELMGILGEHDKDTLLTLLRDQLTEYEATDSSRPWKMAFEVIASVAQRDAGADGMYIAYASASVIQDYVDFTAANDLLLILDVQFGRKTVAQEIEAVREWLSYQHVHLAIDPEFAIKEGETPGIELGQIDATDVRLAQELLVEISRNDGIPPKLLIVHQFNLYSLTNRDQIVQIPDVQYVLEVDGWGAPEAKRDTYTVVGGNVPHEFYGFKLWYRQDAPLMTAAEVMSLQPPPDIVIYQ